MHFFYFGNWDLYLSFFYYAGAYHGNRMALSYRILIGCILLIAGVVGTIYPAIYTSQLTAPRYQALVKSIEDLAANPNIKVFVVQGTSTANYILVSSIYFNKFYQALNLNALMV